MSEAGKRLVAAAKEVDELAKGTVGIDLATRVIGFSPQASMDADEWRRLFPADRYRVSLGVGPDGIEMVWIRVKPVKRTTKAEINDMAMAAVKRTGRKLNPRLRGR